MCLWTEVVLRTRVCLDLGWTLNLAEPIAEKLFKLHPGLPTPGMWVEGFWCWTLCLAQLPGPSSTSRRLCACALPSFRMKEIQSVLCSSTKLFFTVQSITGGMNPHDLVLLLHPVGIAKYFNTKNTHYPFNSFRNLPLGTACFSEWQIAPSQQPGTVFTKNRGFFTKNSFYLPLGI